MSDRSKSLLRWLPLLVLAAGCVATFARVELATALQGERIEAVEQRAGADHDAISELKGDVKVIRAIVERLESRQGR